MFNCRYSIHAAAVMLCLLAPAQIKAQSNIDALRKAAQQEIADQKTPDERSESFTSGALGLQALNPELSVTGDFLWSSGEERDSDFLYRGIGLHLEAYLDPYTKFKAALEFNEDETELGEAYMTRFGILPQANLTLGKFRQQFGVVNRWHKHGLDQVDFPLALRAIFGPGGLNQTGASIAWSMPSCCGCAQELVAQVTDGTNPRVFGENEDNAPSFLAHYKCYRDLTDSVYAELGFTGLYGKNNSWAVIDALEKNELTATVSGVDLTLLWEPTDNMRYRNLTWRSEAYFLNKDILAPDGSGKDRLSAWGAYSYVESKVSRTLIIGARGDYFVPDTKEYADFVSADGSSLSLNPLASTEDGPYSWQVCPYITWYQSPFVHFRVEYDHLKKGNGDNDADTLWLQCIFAAGPHKHERY